MKKFLLIAVIGFILFSCKSKLPFAVPPAEFKEKVVERLVPYEVPADSAQFYALLECDSMKNIIIREFSEYKSTGMQSGFSLNQNALSYVAYRTVDTVYILVKDTTRIANIPYPVKVETFVKVNELTKFQSFQMKAALVSEALVVLLLILGIKNINIFTIIKNLIKK